jgi:hypothetical protein
MELKLTSQVPSEFKTKKPLKVYETRFLYTGLSRYNVETKMISSFRPKGDTILYSESPFPGTTFPRVYSVEHVTVTVYSESPKIWSEELSPQDLHFFQQVVTA